MAEGGLVCFAHVAREVAESVLPTYRSKYSKHLFTQPSLLAILCLMRYEDWTFREAEVRLEEQQELRAALGLERVPDYTTRYRFLRRLDQEGVTHALTAVVARLPPSTPEAMVVAVAATGFSPTAASRYFVDLTRHRGAERTRQHWPKWVVAVDVPRRVVLGQLAYAGPANASALFRPVVDRARPTGVIGLVLADAEFASERNHHHIRDHVGADSILPAKRGKLTWQLQGIRAQMRASFPTVRYRQRTLVERVFSAAKRKLSSRAPGRLPVTQHLQVRLLGLAYDIYRVRRALSLPLC
jgi:Transposase DDE domain/Transposase domain (DUF772)